MSLPKSFTTVTTFSKILALVLFIALPIIGFYSGMRYQQSLSSLQGADPRTKIFATQEECESFTNRMCLPTLCQTNPPHASCKNNDQKGYYATRVEIGSNYASNDFSDWKTYYIVNTPQKIEYKLPPNVSAPELINGTFPYQRITLPGNKNMSIMVIDKEQLQTVSSDKTFNDLIFELYYGFPVMDSELLGIPGAVFSGTFENPDGTKQNMLISDKGTGRLDGEYYQINENYALYILLYQRENQQIQNVKSDNILSNQILSTFRFLDEEISEKTIQLFYYNINLDPEIFCISEAVVPVKRTIPTSDGKEMIDDTIRMLIQGDLTEEEITNGYSTEFPNPEFKLKNSTLENGVLTLTFTETFGFTSGGACRVGLLRDQVEKTAMQFPEVSQVIFDPPVFQP